MPNTTTTVAAAGKVTAARDGMILFRPANTNYELHLAAPSYTGAIGKPVKCVIRAKARKVLTVPSGGNFIVPIFGPPKTVQGLVRAIDGNTILIHAAAPVYVELPRNDDGIDQDVGPITLGKMVNVICEPGATGEIIG